MFWGNHAFIRKIEHKLIENTLYYIIYLFSRVFFTSTKFVSEFLILFLQFNLRKFILSYSKGQGSGEKHKHRLVPRRLSLDDLKFARKARKAGRKKIYPSHAGPLHFVTSHPHAFHSRCQVLNSPFPSRNDKAIKSNVKH